MEALLFRNPIRLFINEIPLFLLEGLYLSFQKIIVKTFFLRTTQERHGGGFIVQKLNRPINKFNSIVRLYSLTFQKTIVWTNSILKKKMMIPF